MRSVVPDIRPLPVEASLLGESPFWHPDERALWWCDIPGRGLHRYHPDTGAHRSWHFDTDVACAAPVAGGDLLLACATASGGSTPRAGSARP